MPDCANQVKEKQSSDLLKERVLHFRHYKKTDLKHEDLGQIEREWAGAIHQAPGSSKSKGLLTLFSNKIKKEDLKLIKSSDLFYYYRAKKG